MRVIRSTALKITSPAFVGDDGETPEDCTGTPTATVAHEDGTALAALTPAITDAPGLYSGTLTTTHTANLGRLTVTWTGTVDSLQQVYKQTFDVVGAHLVSIPEIRDERGLDNTTHYPLATVRRIRDLWADRLEEITGVSMVQRYQRDTLDGDGTGRLALSKLFPTTLISVTVNGVAQTVSEFTLDASGMIRWEGGTFPHVTATTPGNVVVAYEHGLSSVGEDIRHEVIKAIRADLLRTRQDLPTDAISQTFDGGHTIRFSTPSFDQGRPTGILSFDAVLARYNWRTPAVG